MIIVGEKEQQGNMVSVRQRDAEAGQQDMGEMLLDEFLHFLLDNPM